MYYFIEDNGYDGLNIEECETIDSLVRTIKKSNALCPAMLIEGKEIKINWHKMKRTTYWDKTKETEIQELGIHIFGQEKRKKKW